MFSYFILYIKRARTSFAAAFVLLHVVHKIKHNFSIEGYIQSRQKKETLLSRVKISSLRF